MRVLVTGAAGFIGAHVVREALAAGHEVRAVVRTGASAPRLDAIAGTSGSGGSVARPTLVRLDLADRARTAAVLRSERPDAVIHLAWYAEPGKYRTALAENVASLEATAGLLVAAADAGCGRVVLGGTCLEGDDGRDAADGPGTGAGSAPDRPIYAAAKRAAHELGSGFGGAGLSVACGHVFYLYGPFEDERRVLPSVIRSVIAGQPIDTTTGTQTRDYLHVADVAAGFVALAGATVGGGVDICSGSLVTLADVLRIVGDETGRPDLIRIGALGPGDDSGHGAAGDPQPLRAIGWQPRHELRAGIRDTIGWWTARQEANP
jgi:nucleoside-diphosphate-sugar epimerase